MIQNGGTFHLFHEEKIGELLAKNTARRVKRELGWTDDICYLENICKTEQPFISDKHALSKMNLTSMEVSMFKLGMILNE